MARMPDDNLVLSRQWGSIRYAVRRNGNVPAKEFIESLDVKPRIKLETLLRRMAEHGQVKNEQKFRHLVGKIWEFKSDQNRVLCFLHGKSWILTHGFIKKQDKTPPKEIARAEDIMGEHLERI
jgi:phage-related protein